MKEKNIKNNDHPFNGLNENEIDSSAGINSDESMSGSAYLNDQLEEDNENEKLAAELQEQKDKYLRLVAEFDNYRKRTAKERIELIQTAGREVISSLLDVLDDAERAEKQLQNTSDVPKALEGVQLVFNKLRSVLQSKGLKQMESINTDFDVEKHEAITEIPAPNDKLKGKVVDEVQKGYYLNDKLIRFAKVVVGK
ncbi:MAG: nucleotide exchange factor GrpE [Bacteroidetes bacterium]|nr:nucleotide exchange factor GrpE [Bacteroidota bacterium]